MPKPASDRCLHEVFADQVERRPDAPALVDATTSLTYAELDARADRLAARMRAYGVGPDELVGVLMDRRADYVVACLAALKAGGAFLVLELAYPPELLGDVLADAEPRVVVTLGAHADRLPADQPRIVLDADGGVAPPETDPQSIVDPDPESLAFVSYSSGTTGRPKGIANPHRAALRSYRWRHGLSDQRPGDRVACNVFFVWEMLRPLLRGATVYVIGDDVVYDPAALVAFLGEHRITETLMTPSLLETVLARTGPDLRTQVPDLRVLWLNGEIVTRTLARRAVRALPGARVLNVYSASETHEIAAGDLRDLLELDTTYCAVGRPLDPAHVYVLDTRGEPVPPGVEGELVVGGGCLARGYLNLPDKTAETFVHDRFSGEDRARMYRTGDRARVVGDGVLEITGRVGTMVKIRGYSVEPGAVEAALESALAIRNCAVIAAGEGDDRELIAYLVRERDRAAAGDRVDDWEVAASGRSPGIRRALAARLPHYMIPARYVEIDALPLHASGKVDLRRLPDPPTGVVREPQVAGHAATATDDDLIALWATVLETVPDDIGAHDDFFDLGGHSLAVAELGARIADAFGVEVALQELVARPTPVGQRDAVRAAADGRSQQIDNVDLHAQVALDPDITPRGSRGDRGLDEADVVLLTGATGFLGGFLLDSLVRSTTARIVCLVRPASSSEAVGHAYPGDDGDDSERAGVRRLRRSLAHRDMWQPHLAERVTALIGDLAKPRFGLSEAAFDQLASEVDAIVHAGARVNLVYPYQALRAVNVEGTREVLRLACHAGGVPVHHISTSGVLPPSSDPWTEDAPLDEVASDLTDGYGQTKWVAEQLVHEARRRGLPVTVYRPGTLSGHSATGVANGRDLLGAVITESLHLGCAPDVDEWHAEMTPVDHVSDAIAHLAADDDVQGRVFHLADPAPLPARTLFERLSTLGYRVEHVDWDEWVSRWRDRRASRATVEPAAVLRGGMPSADDLRAITVLDDKATRPHLERHGLRRPHIDTDLLAAYTRRFHAEGWIDRPPLERPGSAA